MSSDPFVKALAHPIRRAIVEEAARGEVTPKDIADARALPLGVVAYHVRMLRQYGVIAEVRTEPRRGALQHFYGIAPAAVDELKITAALVNNALSSARRHARAVERAALKAAA
jgi:DNA-binding transcriptional ArsR family regulator